MATIGGPENSCWCLFASLFLLFVCVWVLLPAHLWLCFNAYFIACFCFDCLLMYVFVLCIMYCMFFLFYFLKLERNVGSKWILVHTCLMVRGGSLLILRFVGQRSRSQLQKIEQKLDTFFCFQVTVYMYVWFGKTKIFNSLLGNRPNVFCWASDYLIRSSFWSPE
jgi:hypothetical protein